MRLPKDARMEPITKVVPFKVELIRIDKRAGDAEPLPELQLGIIDRRSNPDRQSPQRLPRDGGIDRNELEPTFQGQASERGVRRPFQAEPKRSINAQPVRK